MVIFSFCENFLLSKKAFNSKKLSDKPFENADIKLRIKNADILEPSSAE